MTSLRARALGVAVRLLIRRRDWGTPAATVRRARRWFGTPRAWQWVRSLGVRVTATSGDDPPGEWLVRDPAATTTILYLHGGGYVACSPATHRPITTALARLTPARVFALDYRLAPEHPWPAALEDAERAYRWLLAGGTSPASLAVAGDSAGGGLALALLLRLRDAGIPLPAAAVLLSPWTDLTGSGASVRGNDGRCAMFRPENLVPFATCCAPPSAWRDPEVSPLFGKLDGLPPVHLQVGASELLLDDAVRVHERIQAAGGSSELVVWEGMFHGWHMLDGVVPEARQALQRAGRFIRSCLATGTAPPPGGGRDRRHPPGS